MPTIYFKKKIGNTTYNFSADGENLYEMLSEKKKLSFGNVHRCGKCGSQNLDLSCHETKEGGHEYAKIICLDCKAFLNFGKQKKDPNIFYLRKTLDENGNKILEWKNMEDTQQQNQPPQPPPQNQQYPPQGPSNTGQYQ